MRAIEIRRNGSVICTAGAHRGTLLAVDLSANVEDTAAALSVHGMADLEDGANLHLWWLNHLQIDDRDELTFTLVETNEVTPTREAEASDSPEFTAKQNEYNRELATNPIAQRAMPRSHSGVAFEIRSVKGQVTARLEEPREFLSVLLNWNNFGEERGRFSISSFSQIEALSRTGGQDWMSGAFKLNDTLNVRVLYNSTFDTDAKMRRSI
jgi:hypothetical protein